MPGSVVPSKNSSEAPPPVDTWLTASARPIPEIAEAESPPPTIVMAPNCVTCAKD